MKYFSLIILTILFVFCPVFSCTKNDKSTNLGKSVEEAATVLSEKGAKVAESNNEIVFEDFEKGKNIHSFKMKSLKSGEEITFGNYKGKRIIIDFWASWCEPCVEMFPLFNRLKREYEDGKQNLKILSISVDPMPGKIKRIIKEKNVEFETLQATETLAESGVLMPYIVVADESGKVVYASTGELSYEELVKMAEGK